MNTDKSELDAKGNGIIADVIKSLPSEEDIVRQFPEDNEGDVNNGIEDDCYARRDGARWVVEVVKRALAKGNVL
jgi:hypothetical protein